MFAYNAIPDTSGQIYGQYQLQGAQSLAQGMGQGATGISDAIKQMNQIQLQHQMAQGALNSAQGLVDKGYMDQKTLDNLKSLPPVQQIGAAQNILPMLQAAGMMSYHSAMLGLKQEALDKKDANSTTQMAKLYTP